MDGIYCGVSATFGTLSFTVAHMHSFAPYRFGVAMLLSKIYGVLWCRLDFREECFWQGRGRAVVRW